MALTLKQIVKEVLLVWAIETDQLSTSYSYLLDSAILCVNGALQVMWALGDDSFSNSTQAIVLLPDTPKYALSDFTQNSEGPCRFQSDGSTLRRLLSRGEFDNFPRMFLGATVNTMTHARPQAYWIEMQNQATNNPSRVNLYVAPSPIISETVLIDLKIEAPNYSRTDYCANVAVPVPHRYVESILLPLARYEATRSYQSLQTPAQEKVVPIMKEFYDRAMMILRAVRPTNEISDSVAPSSLSAPGQKKGAAK